MSTRSSLRPEQRVEHAKELMLQFAERTRIEAGGPNARRYLWTDAYAVCNFAWFLKRSNVELAEASTQVNPQVLLRPTFGMGWLNAIQRPRFCGSFFTKRRVPRAFYSCCSPLGQ